MIFVKEINHFELSNKIMNITLDVVIQTLIEVINLFIIKNAIKDVQYNEYSR